jgi:ribonuclease BN (tRNA processing enzyme)
MKIHFLGTGAADWNIEKDLENPEYRRNSSILINDNLLVDPGSCIFEFEQTFGYKNLYKNVKNIVCTHKHSDHYNPETVSKLGLEITELPLFEPTKVGEYVITALPANHKTADDPRHLIIEEKLGSKRFFYGLDGAWLTYETAKYMRQFNYDMMLFDATLGSKEDLGGVLDYRIFEHNSLEMVELLCNTFKNNCKFFYISHMAKTLHRNHNALADYMQSKGINVAYDNHIVEI